MAKWRNGQRAREERSRWPFVAALVSGVALSGCQHDNLSVQRQSPLVMTGAGTPQLTDEQIADVQVAMGRSLEQQGQRERAVAAYQEAVKHDPKQAQAWLRLAVLHDQQAKFTEAQECYRKALAAKPGSPDIYCNMGYSLYLQRRWAEAEMNLRQALALRPEHSRAHNNLGLVLAHAGREDEALAEFQKAGCSKAEAHANLAFVLLLENDTSQARRHYEEALAADPKSAAAKKGLQDLDRLSARAEHAGQVQPAGLAQAAPATPPAGLAQAAPATPPAK